MLTQLVGNLPPSSFYLPCISLSHFAAASACPLQPFTSEPKGINRSLSLSLLLSLSFTLCLALPFFRRPSAPASFARRFHPSVFHRRFRKSQPLPSIYEIAHVISCPPSPLSPLLPPSTARRSPTLPHKSLQMHLLFHYLSFPLALRGR